LTVETLKQNDQSNSTRSSSMSPVNRREVITALAALPFARGVKAPSIIDAAPGPVANPELASESAFQVVQRDEHTGREHLMATTKTRRRANGYAAYWNKGASRRLEKAVEVRPVTLAFSGDCYMPFEIVLDYRGSERDQWRPSHAFDVPPHSEGDGDSCEEFFDGTFVTRERALELTAEKNVALSDDPTNWDTDGLFTWWVAIEVGRSLPDESIFNIDLYDRVGYGHFSIERPVRIVTPTAAELAKYAPDRWEWIDESPAVRRTI
jgi:hypothetical protein